MVNETPTTPFAPRARAAADRTGGCGWRRSPRLYKPKATRRSPPRSTARWSRTRRARPERERSAIASRAGLGLGGGSAPASAGVSRASTRGAAEAWRWGFATGFGEAAEAARARPAPEAAEPAGRRRGGGRRLRDRRRRRRWRAPAEAEAAAGRRRRATAAGAAEEAPVARRRLLRRGRRAAARRPAEWRATGGGSAGPARRLSRRGRGLFGRLRCSAGGAGFPGGASGSMSTITSPGGSNVRGSRETIEERRGVKREHDRDDERAKPGRPDGRRLEDPPVQRRGGHGAGAFGAPEAGAAGARRKSAARCGGARTRWRCG